MMIHFLLAHNDLEAAKYLYDELYDESEKEKAFSFVDQFGDGIFHFTARGIILKENSSLSSEENIISFVLQRFIDLRSENTELLKEKKELMTNLLENQIYITNEIYSVFEKFSLQKKLSNW